MGYDTTYTEYHLTPKGWIKGIWSVNEPPQSSSLPPGDRIETWLEKETTHDTYISKPTREWKLIWASHNYTEEDRKRIRETVRNEVATQKGQHSRLFMDFPL